jgi:ABC-type polysaccharide/polyol phosphate transport system ATPase subunit
MSAGAAPRLVFDRVTKTFRDRRSPRVLRDAIPDAVARAFGRRRAPRERFTALSDLSFAVAPGEALGIVGRNGAGKSTTLKLAAGIFRPDSGTVRKDGRVSAMIELSAGFHPDLSGRENVFLSAALLGLRRRDAVRLLPEILDFADIGTFVDAPLRVYSTGMVVRLGFAVAAFVPSEILLVDEVLAVGDLDFHVKCVDRMASRRRENVSLLLVSHQLPVVEQFCDRALLVDGGRAVVEGEPERVVDDYRRRMLAEERGPEGSKDPEVRRGSGEVRIVRVVVAGENPEDARVVSGRPFTVTLTLQCASGAASPSLGVEVHASNGTLLTRSESPGAENVALPEGTHVAVATFRANALLPGAYVLTVFARDPHGHRDFDVQTRAHRFAVHGERKWGEQGALTLDAVWRRP